MDLPVAAPSTTVVFAVCTLLVLVTVQKYLEWRRLVASTPPSLPPLPILGNFFDIPQSDPWKTYLEWGKMFNSDVISVRTFGDYTVVINTDKAARALLTKRAQVYSDRPRITTFELQGWDWNTALMPYGDRWRDRRRVLHRTLNINAVDAHLPVQVTHCKKLLLRFNSDPKRFFDHIKSFTTGVSMSIAYAHEVTDDDPYIEAAEKSFQMLSESTFPGATLVNAIPILKYLPEWFPGAGFQKFARECKTLTTKMRFGPLEEVKQKMESGTALPSIARSLFEQEDTAKDLDLIADVAGIIYAGGSDTLRSTLCSAISALAIRPEIQRRAWEEIDMIVGRNRLPVIEDRASMPYTEAICREVHRWRTVTPLGVNRVTTSDDEYEGYFIPKGTNILWNTWAIANDPTVYPEPQIFDPERWLDSNGQLNGKEFDAAFGYGRRICVGVNLAKSSLWQAVACLLAVMEFRKSKDENGIEIEIPYKDTGGLVNHPVPFKCDIVPRDQRAIELLENIASE